MKISTIKLGNETYPLVMNMKAIEEIIERFGGMDEMSAAMDSDSMLEQLRAIDDLLVILINAGIRYCKAIGKEAPSELDFDPADVLDLSDPGIITALKGAMIKSQEQTIEAKPPKGGRSKNAQAPAD